MKLLVRLKSTKFNQGSILIYKSLRKNPNQEFLGLSPNFAFIQMKLWVIDSNVDI